MVCPKFQLPPCISSEKVRAKGSTFVSILQLRVHPKRCFYLVVPNVPKTLVIGQSMWLFPPKKKKRLWACSQELINMNHTTYAPLTIFFLFGNLLLFSFPMTWHHDVFSNFMDFWFWEHPQWCSAQHVTLHITFGWRKVKTCLFGSAKWFWPNMFAVY
jgi:hypothetical protein